MFRLDENMLHDLIHLPEGQRIIGFRGDPVRLCIDVCVEGDGLPECPPLTEAQIINVDEYVTWPAARWAARGRELAELVEAVAARLDDESADVDAGSWANALRRVLAGTYDPRVLRTTPEVVA